MNLLKRFLGLYWSVYIFSFINSGCIYLILEFGNQHLPINDILYSVMNIFIFFLLHLILYVLVRRHYISQIIMLVLFFPLSIINYYTILFRGTPVTTADIYNIGTAVDVAGSYNFVISKMILAVIILAFAGLAIVCITRKYEKNVLSSNIKLLEGIGILLVTSVFMYVSFFSSNPIKPKNTLTWSWRESYHKYGYIPCTIEVMQRMQTPVKNSGGGTAVLNWRHMRTAT